jgi:hypothetical protein
VLLKIDAHCIDGQADTGNNRITEAFDHQDAQPEALPELVVMSAVTSGNDANLWRADSAVWSAS